MLGKSVNTECSLFWVFRITLLVLCMGWHMVKWCQVAHNFGSVLSLSLVHSVLGTHCSGTAQHNREQDTFPSVFFGWRTKFIFLLKRPLRKVSQNKIRRTFGPRWKFCKENKSLRYLVFKTRWHRGYLLGKRRYPFLNWTGCPACSSGSLLFFSTSISCPLILSIFVYLLIFWLLFYQC